MAWPGILACLGLFWLKSASISLVAISLLRWQVLDICKDVSATQGAHLNQKLTPEFKEKTDGKVMMPREGPNPGNLKMSNYI